MNISCLLESFTLVYGSCSLSSLSLIRFDGSVFSLDASRLGLEIYCQTFPLQVSPAKRKKVVF
jgi:hypothetical protein